MMWLIVISCILGIGAGMVIPFSTGLVVDYFTGDYRVRQLGYSSSINNLTLVLATVVTGYLANVDWHLPFWSIPCRVFRSRCRSCSSGSAPSPNRNRASNCATR